MRVQQPGDWRLQQWTQKLPVVISVTTYDGLSARPSQSRFLVLQQAPRHYYSVSHLSCHLLRSPRNLVPCCGLLVSLGWTWSERERASFPVCAKLPQSHPTLPPHGLQPTRLLCPWDSPARILEWVAMLFSRGSSRPRDRIHVSCLLHWQAGS